MPKINYNSVETVPGFQAKAAFQVNSAAVFREDNDIVPVVIDDKLSYMPWGGDNMMPFNILNLIESDETLSTCQIFNAEVCYGSGLVYNSDRASASVKDEIDDFFLDNDMSTYFLGACQDFKHFGFCVSVIILNGDASKIVSLQRKEACYCRFSPDDEKESYNVYPKLQVYNVFNIAQTNLAEARPELYAEIIRDFESGKPEHTGDGFRFEPVDTMIADNKWYCPIKPTQGNNAYFSISKNEIVIPLYEQFRDGESYYSNLFHEMCHSTGTDELLKRLKPASFGSKAYAREELVAELTAALTAQYYGMSKHIKDDSAAYLKSWLKSLKEDASFIKTILLDVKHATAMLTRRIDEVAQSPRSR